VYANSAADYNKTINELKTFHESGDAAGCLDDFIAQDPKTFCRAFLSRTPISDSIENNVCETFNGCIVKYRGLCILKMLEETRCYMMQRIVNKHNQYSNGGNGFQLCPRIKIRVERTKFGCRMCTIRPSLNVVFECTGE